MYVNGGLDVRKQLESLAQRVAVFDSIGSVLNQEIMSILTRVTHPNSLPA